MKFSAKRYTIFFWSGILVILSLNVLLWLYVNQIEEKFKTELQTRLLSTNRAVSRIIDEDLLSAIIPGEINSLEYISIQQTIESIRLQDSLQSILLLSPLGEIIVSSPEILNIQGEISRVNSPRFIEATQGNYGISEIEFISEEPFMSSYGPIFNIDGFITGVQIIEAKATYFETLGNLRNQLFIFSLFNFIIIAIIALFLFRMIDRTIKFQATIKDNEHLVQLGTMAATVAHEIRNPLGIIDGSNELIKKKYGANDDEIFDYIPVEVKRLSAIIESFLNFARTPNIKNEKFDLKDLLDRIKVGIPSDKKVALKIAGIENQIPLISDSALLEQVLLNTISNAIEASAENESIHVRVIDQKNKIVIEIKDNGIGMDKETQLKIFQPFFSTKEKGTGLGLAVTKRIIELLDGSIQVNSEEGKGTTIHLTIPRWARKN